ncbi:hypothetical protein NKJ94_34115 [Mesorhizobium sp. M0060]
MTEHLHDGVDARTTLDQLRADGMAEAMRGDRSAATIVDKTSCLASRLQRCLKQRPRRYALAFQREESPYFDAGAFISKPAAWRIQCLKLTNSHGGFRVKRNHPLLAGFTSGNPQAWRAVRIRVEAAVLESRNLRTSGAAPPGDNQRGSLMDVRQHARGFRGK